jgi:SPP1 family predicted phage head-tail adaptor
MPLLDKPTAAGEFRYRVDITKTAILTDPDSGETVKGVTNSETRWAKVEPLSGDEKVNAQRVYEDATYRFTIRYTPNVNNKDQLNFKGRVFSITWVENVQEANQELVIMAKEAVA